MYQDRAAQLSAWSSEHSCEHPLQSVFHKPTDSLHCTAVLSTKWNMFSLAIGQDNDSELKKTMKAIYDDTL